ncbi:MAG TPA: MerR family transcriptional regulator [Nocardioidaceae bacterium]|nr:MerR family transcriptional regulator [Nocardioidaceae bacterium]
MADLSIGEVAERTGLSVHALRFYERQGLLPFTVRRGSDGRRRYSEDDLGWMTVVLNLRASGMPLAGIRRYAELVRAGSGNEAERLDLLREQRERVATQLADLNACMDLITYKVKIYEDIVATDH